MATGIIQVDLHQSKSGFYFNSTKELIDKYLSGDHSLETINELIIELIDDELIYFTEEDFIYWALHETKYYIISQETFTKLKQDEMLPSALDYSLAMYGNFIYEDKKVSSIPITSPVDFISGPNIRSTPSNLLNGKTDSFTLKFFNSLIL